jgi:hypothetical protein
MDIQEVIRKEGNVIVLYSKDESVVLGRFPFGKGEKYTSEEAAREAAEKRERQIQFFKTQEGQELLEQKRHSRKWHRCWEEVQKQGYSESRAAAICTWSLKKTSSVFEALGLKSNEVAISLDDANEMDGDGLLAAQMERDGIAALIVDTDTWQIREIPEGSDEALAFAVEPELLTTEPDGLPGVLVAAQESDTRELVETWDRSDTQAQIDESGNLSGIVLAARLFLPGNQFMLTIRREQKRKTDQRDRSEIWSGNCQNQYLISTLRKLRRVNSQAVTRYIIAMQN